MQQKLGKNSVSIKIVGLKYSDVKIENGTTLKLIEDNNNKFDENAVMVVTMKGEKIGFVANNKKGTLSNKFYKNFKSATDLRNLVNLKETFVCGNINIKGSYGLMKVTI